jgi:hypothetical protein
MRKHWKKERPIHSFASLQLQLLPEPRAMALNRSGTTSFQLSGEKESNLHASHSTAKDRLC